MSRRGEVPWNNISITTCTCPRLCLVTATEPGSECERHQSWKGLCPPALLGDCSHSQSRAHPIPCPLQEMAPCCCACLWGHHSVDSDSPYIQNSCNAWKPSSSTDASPLCHPYIDLPHWHSPTSFTHTQMLFLGSGCQNSQTKITLL